METRDKIIYWIATGLLSALMIMNVIMYVIQNEMVSETFIRLGYPTYIIYPLAIAKLLGIIAILTRRSKLLIEWAYAGFFFVFVLAFTGHINASDGEFAPPVVAIIFVLVSRFYEDKVFGSNEVRPEPASTFEAIPHGTR